jgi:flagellar protein FlaG
MIQRVDGLTPVSPQISDGGGYTPPAASSEQTFELTSQQIGDSASRQELADVFESSGKQRGADDVAVRIKGTEAREEPDQDLKDMPLEKTIERLNEKLNLLNRQLSFRLDERIGRNYISIIDKQTKETIKEFPPEEIRDFIAQMIELEDRMKEDGSSENNGELFVNLEV